ncbi:MAG: WG repeat-containing protein, partial [Clostridia bacterium]|nr:WG repeat-containing protein [Clostridia bacterium]
TKGFDGEYCLAQLPKSHGDDYILINRKGKEVSLPENCSPQSSFSDGLAIIWDYSDNLYGFIDPDGNVVIEPQYEVAYEFSEGLACVKLIDGQWAMIDVNNNIIMLRPDRADYNLSSQYCSHGLIRCALPDTDTIVYYDREGKEAFSLQIEGLDWITEFRDNGVAFFIVDPAAQEYKDGQDSFGLINDRGEIVTQPVYWNDGYNWEFSDGLFAASEHDTGKSGYLDENGQWAFPPVEGHLEPFREGVGCIYKYPDVIFVDREGNELYRYVQ